MLRALIIVPLLIIPIFFYLLISMTAGEGGTAARLQANLFSMPMMSGGRWASHPQDAYCNGARRACDRALSMPCPVLLNH